MKKDMTNASTGQIIHEPTILSSLLCEISNCMARPTPVIAPTTAWAVLTGTRQSVAIVTKSPAKASAVRMALGGTWTVTIFLPTSEMRYWPSSTEPSSANNAVIMTAVRKLSIPEPTVGPMQLAVSLAPMFQPT